MFRIALLLLPLLTAVTSMEITGTTLEDLALECISEAHASVVVEQEEPTEHLTPAEQRFLGRYLQRPSLAEVYPGIGQALARNRR